MSRTRRTYAVYVSYGTEVTFQTASAKYDHAGLVRSRDGKAWSVVALGYSLPSVIKRTRTAARRAYNADWDIRSNSCTSQVWEVSAPVVSEYFGHNRLWITAVFLDGGWQEVSYHAGRSLLRTLAKEGVKAVCVQGCGQVNHPVEREGLHEADFQMDEIVRSMSARKSR